MMKPFRPVFFVFILINSLALTGKSWMEGAGISQAVVISGNLILFGVITAAYFITARSLKSTNPQAFMRAMYGSFMIKFFLLALGAFIYIMVMKNEVNKPALAICAALYIIYTAVEIRALLQQLKKKQDA